MQCGAGASETTSRGLVAGAGAGAVLCELPFVMTGRPPSGCASASIEVSTMANYIEPGLEEGPKD